MITIGIPTHNRLDILKLTAASLMQSGINIPVNIRIYDDASTEYGEDVLKEIFPSAVSIRKHKENHGADYNMRYMYSDFLKSEDEYFFNCDSDLIFSKGWLDKALEMIKMTDGVLSLFNTPSHSIVEEKNGLCIKNDLGGAGTLFTRECVRLIVQEMKVYDPIHYDWEWSNYLQNKGKRIYSVKDSLVQHIGLIGQNSMLERYDYGEGFKVDSTVNGQIFNDLLMKISTLNSSYPFSGWAALFPYEKVPVNSRIIIYGAGKAGMDFKRQIELNRFCELKALIDMKTHDGRQVLSVERLEKDDYDYIILAAASEKVQVDMEEAILSKYPFLKRRIIKPDLNVIRLREPGK